MSKQLVASTKRKLYEENKDLDTGTNMEVSEDEEPTCTGMASV